MRTIKNWLIYNPGSFFGCLAGFLIVCGLVALQYTPCAGHGFC